MDEVDSAFQQLSQEFDPFFHGLRRLSSVMQQNNNGTVMDAKYQTGDFQRNGYFGQLEDDLLSSEEEEDEAQIFVKKTIKNTFYKNSQPQSIQVNDNLLLKEEEDFDQKTPRMINTDDEDNGNDSGQDDYPDDKYWKNRNMPLMMKDMVIQELEMKKEISEEDGGTYEDAEPEN